MPTRFITLVTPAFDLLGELRVKIEQPDSLYQHEHRAEILPTLDGGVVADDVGAFDADRRWGLSIILEGGREAEILERLVYYHDNYLELYLSTVLGFFRVAVLSMTPQPGRVLFNVHVLQKLST